MVIGTLGLGFLADRRSGVAILMFVFSIQLGSFAVLLTDPELWVVFASLLVSGIVAGGFLPVIGHLIAEQFGAANLGRAMGIANLGLLPFGFGLPMIAGALRDASGSYRAVMILCMGLLFVAVVALALLARQIRRPTATDAPPPQPL